VGAASTEYTPSEAHVAQHDAEFEDWLVAQYEAGATPRQIEAAIHAAHAVEMRRVEATFARWREAEAAADAAPDDEQLAARLLAAQRDAVRLADSVPPRPPAATPLWRRVPAPLRRLDRRLGCGRPRRRRTAATRAAGVRSSQDPGDPEPADEHPDSVVDAKFQATASHRKAVAP
jgi:hypothetical protein